jgi:small-conductance mechanosensitive channel
LKEFLYSPTAYNLYYSIITILVIYLITSIITRLINRQIEDIKRRHRARKTVLYIASIIAIIIILGIWVKALGSITIIISAIGAGLALALHQAILSIAGWLLILLRRPYNTGDRIEMGGRSGDVIDIHLFYTILLEIKGWLVGEQSTGRLIYVPNSKVFTEPLINYTQGFEYIWNEIPIVVTFESNWQKAKDIMMEVVEKEEFKVSQKLQKELTVMARRHMIFYRTLTPTVWVNIVDFGVELTLRYITEARNRRKTRDVFCQAILQRFQKEKNIDFAYPTYRIYRRGEEESP